MLAPLQSNRKRGVTYESANVAAPVRGWNAKDSLANMHAESAVVLDNMFPNLEDVTLRKGHAEHSTGVGTVAVETLVEYAPATGIHKLLSAGGGSIYDSSAAAAATSLGAGYTSNRWQTTMFNTAGGNFLYLVNGSDAPLYFDGTNLVAPALTGVTPADIVSVTSHRFRLFFCFNNSLSFGYLPVVQIAGAVSKFDLGPLCKKGGYLMAIGSWTRDGGSGPDDVACFITSEGEAVLYSGSDPSVATSWNYVGTFTIGKPTGRRCIESVGSELVVITQDGFIPLSKFLPIGRVGATSKALSDNIQNRVIADTRSYGNLFGWQAILYPQGSYALFNIPQNATTSYQYVVNTQTNAWCRFKGQNSSCWSLFNGDIYFGAITGGKVFKADTGKSDDGAAIEFKIKPAFNYFGSRGAKKLFTMCRPQFRSNGNIAVAIDLNVDFSDLNPTSIPTAPVLTGGVWNVGLWDVMLWGGSDVVLQEWITVYGIGNCASPTIRGSTSTLSVSFTAYDMIFQKGNVL